MDMSNKVSTEAHKIIHTASGAAAAAAATPIPFADAALLVPIQVTMITSLYKLHGYEMSEGVIKGALASIAATNAARSVVGNLAKFIPGLGSFAGGAINVGVAVSFTEVMGFAIANALQRGELDNSVEGLLGVLEKAVKVVVK